MSDFASYVTRTAFQLSLSQDMIIGLQIAKAYEDRRGRNFPDFGRSVPALKAIQRRGLIEHHLPLGHDPNYVGPAYTLTEAGKHVYALCQLAGLIPVETPVEAAA